MGLFSLIETFFYISLGITFILILLLVFHFKQRITSVEKKNETMFDIINNIVKELTVIRNYQIMATQFTNMQYDIGQNNVSHMNTVYSVSNNVNDTMINAHKVIANHDDDDEDDDEDDDDEDDDEDEDDDDDEDDVEDDDDEDDKMPPLETFDLEEEIKVINVDIENQQIQSDNIPSESVLEDETQENDELPTEIIESDPIQVQKVDLDNEDHLENTSMSDETSSQLDNSKEVYRKMTLTALKTLVITKGLCTDPSKMKKPELVKMLETNIE
jgi:hypothetical protein